MTQQEARDTALQIEVLYRLWLSRQLTAGEDVELKVLSHKLAQHTIGEFHPRKNGL